MFGNSRAFQATSRASRHLVLGFSFSVSLLCFSAPVLASEPSAQATAVQLYDEAEKLMESGRVAEACPKYRESNRLDPQLGALLHLADCYERNHQFASAWSHFRESAEIAKQRRDDREQIANDRAAKLEPRLNRLTIVVSQGARVPGLEIKVDGGVLQPAIGSVPIAVDAGAHTLEARAPGYKVWSAPLNIAGEAQALSFEIPALQPLAGGVGIGFSDGSQKDQSSDSRRRLLRTVGWVTAGIGVVGVGLGVVFLGKKQSKLDEREEVCGKNYYCHSQDEADRIQDLTKQARSADTLAKVSMIAGGVLMAGGITTVLLAPKFAPSERPKTGAWVMPSAGPGTAMIHAGTAF